MFTPYFCTLTISCEATLHAPKSIPWIWLRAHHCSESYATANPVSIKLLFCGHHFKSLQVTIAGEAVEKRGTYMASRNVSWCSYSRKYEGSKKNLKIELPYDPPILPLGICLDKTIIQKDVCTPVFIAAKCPIAKTLEQPKCPSIDEW